MLNKVIEFLNASHSVFHAVSAICAYLDEQGYTRLQEAEKWNLQPGQKYYVTRNLSSVIAFSIPQSAPNCMLITASHCDSPVFKIKENAELDVKGAYVQLDTERYGGAILSTWLDRPLSFAGRVLVRTQYGVEQRLVDLDYDSLVIPNVAPHMKRDINDGMKYNLQTDMVPLYSDSSSKGSFKSRVAELAGCKEEEILGHDLYLYSRMPASVWGPKDEFLSSGRLDDLECAYTTLLGFCESAPQKDTLPVLAIFDNEEVGSTTKQGADSTFLRDVLERVSLAYGLDREDFERVRANSFMLSCDNAHAMHPNHPEFSDSANTVYMNRGIVVKESANQKYTSDAVSKALFRRIMEGAKVPVQFYSNRSDIAGGGTLGNISNRHFSLNTIDIGLAQLSMHSSYETAGTKDVCYMVQGMKAFFESSITALNDREYAVK